MSIVEKLARAGLDKPLFHIFSSVNPSIQNDQLTVQVGESSASFFVEDLKTYRHIRSVTSSERPVIKDLLARVRNKDIFYDVGAGIGSYACLVGATVNQTTIVAFEPYGPRSRLLRRNAKLNGLSIDHHSVGLSDHQEERNWALNYGESDDIEIVHASEYIDKNDIPNPSILKIDVEGAELRTLNGLEDILIDSPPRLIYIELHPDTHPEISGLDQGEIRELEELLQKNGFELSHIHNREEQSFIRAER